MTEVQEVHGGTGGTGGTYFLKISQQLVFSTLLVSKGTQFEARTSLSLYKFIDHIAMSAYPTNLHDLN